MWDYKQYFIIRGKIHASTFRKEKLKQASTKILNVVTQIYVA